MCEETLGDVCESVLAAANAAANSETGETFTWEGLRGGAAPEADAVVPLLVQLLVWQWRP